jgi:hypothetical protein
MPYTPEKPPLPRSIDELRATIPGWGVDLDPKDRPAYPKEQFIGKASGAHWDFPERQPEPYPQLRSNEHEMLTPVFGTTCPPKGISGAIRRYAYRYSEGTVVHWLLLIGADRVDVLENRVLALLSGRPDNPIAESGIKTELQYGVQSRRGQHRADLMHQPIDAVIQLAPYVALGALAYLATRKVRGRR